jgi:threonine aldolase
MNFCSDNVTGASPEILAALTRANTGTVPSYGEDPLTARVQAKLKEIFETDLTAFPVATGTSANALPLGDDAAFRRHLLPARCPYQRR